MENTLQSQTKPMDIKVPIKTLRVDTRVWDRLKDLKRENETFNEVILELLNERTKASGNEDVKAILQKIGDMYAVDPNWHYSDEENFEDLKKRGMQALEFLKSQNKENILVVSHGHFVALLLGLMLFGKEFPVEAALLFRNFFRFGNTGVSICKYEDNKWKLQCWNDTSHLLE